MSSRGWCSNIYHEQFRISFQSSKNLFSLFFNMVLWWIVLMCSREKLINIIKFFCCKCLFPNVLIVEFSAYFSSPNKALFHPTLKSGKKLCIRLSIIFQKSDTTPHSKRESGETVLSYWREIQYTLQNTDAIQYTLQNTDAIKYTLQTTDAIMDGNTNVIRVR